MRVCVCVCVCVCVIEREREREREREKECGRDCLMCACLIYSAVTVLYMLAEAEASVLDRQLLRAL